MNSSLKNKESIRDYLLGRMKGESLLSELEDLLFMDEEFCAEVEIAEDQLINDYVFGRLDPDDKVAFEKTLANNPERSLSVQLATALKEKAGTAPAPAPHKVGFLESIAAFFKQPLYAAGFAVALIGIVIFSYVMLSRRNANEIAELQDIYKNRRQTETRISGFGYAPMSIVRGDDKKEDEEKKLLLFENNLLQAVISSPGAKTHHDLGVFYLNKRDFPKAIKELDLAVKADAGNAAFRNDLGSAYFEAGKLATGEKKFEDLARALEEFSRALELNPGLLEALFNRSLALQESRLPAQAKESWQQYLQKDPSSKWAEEARKQLEKLENQQGAVKTKEQVLEDFLAAWRQKDDESAWKINSQTRDAFSGIWLPDQLSRRYLKAKLRDDPAEEKDSIEALAYIGDLEKTRSADFFVSDIAAGLADLDKTGVQKSIAARDALDQGVLSMNSAEWKAAIAPLEKSVRLFSEIGDPIGKKLGEYWMLQCYSYLGSVEKGLSLSGQAENFARSKNYKWFEASVRYYTGVLLVTRQDLTKGMEFYKATLAYAKEIGDTLLEQRCNHAIIEALIDTGELKETVKYQFDDAKNLYYNSELNNWRNYNFAAKALLSIKLPAAASEFASEALFLARNGTRKRQNNISSSLILLEEAKTATGEYDDALDLANESLALIDISAGDTFQISRKAGILNRIANLESRLGRYEQAAANFREAISLFEKVPEVKLDNYAARRGLLICLKNTGRTDELRAELGAVLSLADGYRRQILDDESRRAFFDNEQAVFDIAVEDSLARGSRTEAFDRAESSRARSLLDLIERKGTIDTLQKEIYAVTEPMRTETVQARMPENSQIVEYALLENRIIAWVISRGDLQTVDLNIDGEKLKASITDLAALSRNRDAPEARRALVSADLYRTLIEPLAKFLDPAKELVVIPDKNLYYVPFAALKAADGRFLVQQYTLSFSPSATIFVTANERSAAAAERPAGKLLTIGDPAFDPERHPGLARLEAAESEAAQIGKMSPGSQALSGESATKRNFTRLMNSAETVHFAGHYIPDPDSPAHSVLVLAGDGGDLKMSEIAGKKFPYLRLVVLSACDTAIEDVIEGEGAIGASRAFLAAGAPTVVASQWMVDSGATEKLMVAFHHNRLFGKMRPAEALRQVQLKLIDDPAGTYASPYFWAAFSVIGGI